MGPCKSVDTVEMVRRSRKGDRVAFGELVKAYQNAAFATAISCVRSRDDAEDVVQDAFVAAYCKLAQLRDPRYFGIWLRRIVTRRALGSVRASRKTRLVSDETDEGQAALAHVSAGRHAHAGRKAELSGLVQALPEKYREPLLVYYLNDFSYADVARYLGLPATTVKGRLQRARRKLRAQLREDEPEEFAMDRVNVKDRVGETITRIVRQEVHERVGLDDVRNVVVFCGIECDVEVCQADGPDVIITGSKTSIGFTEEEARQSVARIDGGEVGEVV